MVQSLSIKIKDYVITPIYLQSSSTVRGAGVQWQRAPGTRNPSRPTSMPLILTYDMNIPVIYLLYIRGGGGGVRGINPKFGRITVTSFTAI